MTAAKDDKLVVGLIGGIGSGKSQVAAAFARHGARIIAGDQLAHAALRDPEVLAKVVGRWGQDALGAEGEIDRRALATIVFADPEELKALESITHPWIRGRLRAELEAARRDPNVPFIVLDAAIMLEAGWDDVCDRLVFIDAPRSVRLERLTRQRGWTEKEMDARERAQLPLTEKAIRADHVLDNSTSLEHLDRQVNDLVHLWGLARASPRSEPEC